VPSLETFYALFLVAALKSPLREPLPGSGMGLRAETSKPMSRQKDSLLPGHVTLMLMPAEGVVNSLLHRTIDS
jgi:hypothetical protein